MAALEEYWYNLGFCSKTDLNSIALNCLSTPSCWCNCRKWSAWGNGNILAVSASVSCQWKTLEAPCGWTTKLHKLGGMSIPRKVHPIPHILAETLTFSCNIACLLRFFLRSLPVVVYYWGEGERDSIGLLRQRSILTLTFYHAMWVGSAAGVVFVMVVHLGLGSY